MRVYNEVSTFTITLMGNHRSAQSYSGSRMQTEQGTEWCVTRLDDRVQRLPPARSMSDAIAACRRDFVGGS